MHERLGSCLARQQWPSPLEEEALGPDNDREIAAAPQRGRVDQLERTRADGAANFPMTLATQQLAVLPARGRKNPLEEKHKETSELEWDAGPHPRV